MQNPKGFIPIIVVAFIAVIAAGVVGVAWYYEENKTETPKTNTVAIETTNDNTNQNTNSPANTNTTADETANWQTYTNETYGYSFKYPSEYNIRKEVTTDEEAVIGCDEGTSCRDGVKVYTTYDSLDAWKNSFDSTIILSTTNTTVDGVNALRINTGEFSTSRVGVLKDGYI